MANIPFGLGNRAGVSVSESQNQNFFVEATGDQIPAGIGVFKKGFPNTIISVTRKNYEDLLGKPLKTRESGWEYIRQLFIVLNATQTVKVVRSVPSAATFPVLTINTDGSTTNSNSLFTAAVNINNYDSSDNSVQDLFKLHPIDGSDEVRKVSIKNIDSTEKVITLEIEDADGNINSFVGGLDLDATDDSGLSYYLPDVIERESNDFKLLVAGDLSDSDKEGFLFTAVSGIQSANGIGEVDASAVSMNAGDSQGLPASSDFIESSNRLKSENEKIDALFTMGNRDSNLIAELQSIANNRRIFLHIDSAPATTYASAVSFKQSLNINDKRVFISHLSLKQDDFFEERKVAIGSAAQSLYCSLLAQKSKVGGADGINNAPADERFGTIFGSGFVDEINEEIPKDSLFDNRINYFKKTPNNNYLLGDILTCTNENNTNRFYNVVNVDNYFANRIFVVGSAFQWGTINSIWKQRLSDFLGEQVFTPFIGNALDVNNPYEIEITEPQFNQVKIQYSFTPNGVARQIIADPIILQKKQS